MPHYKLYYFNARGNAEVVRLVFAQAGVEYEDIRLTSEQWAEASCVVAMWFTLVHRCFLILYNCVRILLPCKVAG
jgi:hypothetical protein